MSNAKELRDYLIDEDYGFLLNNENNGKTIMLSGAWGSGKTHFWQKEIEPKLSKKVKDDKDKACVYVSLYGKDNMESVKSEILFKAYESIKDENKLAKRAISAFGFGSRLLSVSVGGVRANTSAVGDAVEGFFEGKKIDEAETFLADGGIICLDDFERKSKDIDLNDLFGFIAQLAIDMKCKVVIILNSDVFEGAEENVFKTVKEKTVNKFFHFEPTIQELFNSIYNSNEKYNELDDYKVDILSVIEKTDELNARIYIQVLDNCLEWIRKGYSGKLLSGLVFSTVCFIKNHFLLVRTKKLIKDMGHRYGNSMCVLFTVMNHYPTSVNNFFDSLRISEIKEFSTEELISSLKKYLHGKAVNDDDILWVNNNEQELKAVYQYGYKLFQYAENRNTDIENYLKTGILLPKDDL